MAGGELLDLGTGQDKLKLSDSKPALLARISCGSLSNSLRIPDLHS
jgi:hypothetical protein